MTEEKKNMGLYIHIPFCNKKCDYCDFVSYSMDRQAQQDYLEALFGEIDRMKIRMKDKTFDSIFIGGGTPSIVYEGFISSLARKIFSSFHFEPKIEFSIEVNPASFNKTKFFEYVEAGVNRISVGVQCIDARLLKKHGRMQSMENVEDTFSIMEKAGFDNVNGDVMLGLPNQTMSSVLKTIKFLIKKKVKHISTYSLQLEKHTLLADKIRQHKLKPLKDDKILAIYNKVYALLKKHDYKRYEVSNFAKPCFECKHNKKYWNGTDYLGLGVSAHSYIDGYRFFNTKRLDTYIDNLSQGKSPVYKREYVTQEERRTEFVMLSLRTIQGLDLNKYKQEFGVDILKAKATEIKNLTNLGMIEIEKGFLRITESYFYVSNSIIVELI